MHNSVWGNTKSNNAINSCTCSHPNSNHANLAYFFYFILLFLAWKSADCVFIKEGCDYIYCPFPLPTLLELCERKKCNKWENTSKGIPKKIWLIVLLFSLKYYQKIQSFSWMCVLFKANCVMVQGVCQFSLVLMYVCVCDLDIKAERNTQPETVPKITFNFGFLLFRRPHDLRYSTQKQNKTIFATIKKLFKLSI